MSLNLGSSVRRADLRYARRVVVKVGTSVVTNSEGFLAVGRLGHLVEQVWNLYREGKQVVLVTSGAVGLGKLKLEKQARLSASVREFLRVAHKRLAELYDDKAAAAAGQSVLMALYESLFGQFDIQVSQLLLMDDDFAHQDKRMRFRETMEMLLKLKVLPILNENDVMTSRKVPLVDENKAIFWDNDSLACLVASEIQADLVILLSDVDGLYRKLPEAGEVPDVIPTYHVSSKFSFGEKSRVGRGGMQAKIDAAISAVKRGVKAVVIANGYKPDSISKIVHGENIGTLFAPQSFNSTRKMELTDHLPEDSATHMAISARNASRILQNETSEVRSSILNEIAVQLLAQADTILNINQEDVIAAKKGNLSAPLLSRLQLSKSKLQVLADGLRDIGSSSEPLGKVLKKTELSPGLILEQKTAPIGVLMIIFESRPDALPQIAALAIRSGNGLLVKGGTEALRTNKFLYSLIVDAVYKITNGRVPRDLIGFVESKQDIKNLLKLDKHIDLVIPRGSSKMVANIQSNTKIPVLGHAEGICHIYIDEFANFEKAVRIVLDSKTDYPAACNAVETVLIHDSWLENGNAEKLIKLLGQNGVKVFGGPLIAQTFNLQPAESFKIEYSSLSLTLEPVKTLNDAIAFINRYSSGHTESIITENIGNANQFLREVDSSSVFHNASTRFADGYRYGLGAEVGISTGRIHARGPVGVEGLLTTKWNLRSNSDHCVGDFSGKGQKKLTYTHKNMLSSKM